MTHEEIVELLEPYDLPHLECDGATRVFAWLLRKAEVPYVVMCGRIEFADRIVQPHYWLELDDGAVVDFRARMWLPGVEGVPNGVFYPSEVPGFLYVGGEDHAFLVTKTMFNILTRSPNL